MSRNARRANVLSIYIISALAAVCLTCKIFEPIWEKDVNARGRGAGEMKRKCFPISTTLLGGQEVAFGLHALIWLANKRHASTRILCPLWKLPKEQCSVESARVIASRMPNCKTEVSTRRAPSTTSVKHAVTSGRNNLKGTNTNPFVQHQQSIRHSRRA